MHRQRKEPGSEDGVGPMFSESPVNILSVMRYAH